MKFFHWKSLPLLVAIVFTLTLSFGFNTNVQAKKSFVGDGIIDDCPVPQEDDILTLPGCQKMQEYVSCLIENKKLDTNRCKEFKSLLEGGGSSYNDGQRIPFYCDIACTEQELSQMDSGSTLGSSVKTESIVGAILFALLLFY